MEVFTLLWTVLRGPYAYLLVSVLFNSLYSQLQGCTFLLHLLIPCICLVLLIFPILFLNLCTQPWVPEKAVLLATGFPPPIPVCNMQSGGTTFLSLTGQLANGTED